MTGMLNYDVWRWIVGYTVDDMRIDKSFPNFPDVSYIYLTRVDKISLRVVTLKSYIVALN